MIEAGRMLAHYRLVEKIGEGGMGIVWKAVDTRLNREAAIKILPEAFASDVDRRSRFEREARLLAALNHPGIAAVYGLHEADGNHFIAMEFVPGEDLALQLTRGPLPLDEALDVARQVADALETAHEQGVIHRDLKPANIKRSPDGQVKVLDLGLAKALSTEGSLDAGSVSLSPTLTSAGTIAGTLLGTAAYMSPEQVKGKPVDRRADIWAFGCVCYEMLTGERTFGGETISETLASVLRDNPERTDLPRETPAAVRRLLRRCLDRDRKTRLRDIGEARIALSPTSLDQPDEFAPGPTAQEVPAGASRRAIVPWGVAAIALLGLVAAVAFAVLRGAPQSPSEVRVSINPPKDGRFLVNNVHTGSLSLSPDGRYATFIAESDSSRPSLYLRALDSTTPRLLPGTAGASYPFWSPDSREIGFFANGKLMKLDIEGGAALTVASASDGRGGSWGPDGIILYAPDTQSPIHRVSSGGAAGEPATVLDATRNGESTHRFPWFLPDGRHFLYFRGSHSAGTQEPVNSVWVGDLDSDETFEVMPCSTHAVYAQGHLFWVDEQFLMARRFDAATMELTGDAFAVGEQVVGNSSSWRGAFAVSEAGPIAFQTGLTSDSVLTWFDREGGELGTLGTAGRYGRIDLSPDGGTVAASIEDSASGRADIWLLNIQRGVGSRLTFDDANDNAPVWSPDGDRVAFGSNRNGGGSDIYVRSAAGRGEAELLFESDSENVPQDWSSDGKYLAFDLGMGGKYDLWLLPMDGSDAFSFIAGAFDEGYGRFSPDSKWLAYISNETGRYELYLTRVPDADGKWQLTKSGGDWVIGWEANAGAIYYLDLEGKLCTVEIELGDQVVAGEPECLFETRSNQTWASRRDGQSFLLGVPDDTGEGFPITLVLNWDGARPGQAD